MLRVIHLFPWKAVVGGMRGSVPRESRRLIDALRIACVAMETALAFSGFLSLFIESNLKKKLVYRFFLLLVLRGRGFESVARYFIFQVLVLSM
jgi:hypothetical protein